ELVRMCGAFERIPQETKLMLIEHCLRAVTERQESGGYAEPYYVSLTLLLNRSPLCSVPEAVVQTDQVERAFEQLKGLDWEDDAQRELRSLFLRAARVIDNPYLDLPKAVRKKIASKLEKAGVPPVKAVPVRD